MNNSYQKWINTVQKSVTISLSPSAADYKLAIAEYQALTGTENTYEQRDLFDSIVVKYYVKRVHTNISMRRAQEIAEPIRIAHPEQCVSLYAGTTSFVGNTTWNDQMSMFWEYETYTPEGATLAAARKTECDALGKIAAWE
jgi:hypothetical protein